jgi:hypothetical protein
LPLLTIPIISIDFDLAISPVKMQFITLITASITAFLSVTSVIAAPQPLTADVAAVNVARSADTNTSPNPGHKLNKRHGFPFCNPTGPGVCNFAFYASLNDLDGITAWVNGYVYDRYCNEIGQSIGMDVHGTTSVWSQLPYSVVANYPTKSFWYAGRKTDHCIFYYGDDENQDEGHIWQCAFDC